MRQINKLSEPDSYSEIFENDTDTLLLVPSDDENSSTVNQNKRNGEFTLNEARYKALIEDQTEMITRWLPDGTYTFVNDVFCKFFDKPRKDFLGKRFIPMMPIEDLEKFSRFFMKLTKENPVGHFVHRVIMPDNEIMWLKWTDHAILDTQGNIIEYQSVGRDITQRRLAEEKLKQSEERYKRLIEGINVVTWEYDTITKKYEYISKQVEKIFGYPIEQWHKTEDFWFGIIHPDDKEQAIKFCTEHIEKGVNHELEYRVIASNGDVKWIKDITSVYSDNNSKKLHGVMIDITSQKQTQEALEQSEQRYKRIVENTNVITWEYDKNNKSFLYVSPHAEKILGYPIQKWYEKGFWYNHIHPADKEKTVNYSREKAASGKEYEIEYRFIAEDGSYKWFRDITSISYEHDETEKLNGVFIDITNEKHAEELLIQSEERYKTFIEQSSQGIYRTEFDVPIPVDMSVTEKINLYFERGFIAECNLAIAKKYGYSGVEFKGIRTSDIKNKLNASLLKQFFLNHKLNNYETCESRNGKLQFFSHNAVGIIENGMLERIWGTSTDITVQKIAELKLRETELRLTAHINTLPNIVFYESGTSRKFMTENVLDLLGYGADYLIEDFSRFEAIVNPADLADVKASMAEWVKNKTKNIFKCEFRVMRKDGQERWLEDHMFRIELDNNKEYYSGVMLDITERKKAESKMKDSLNEKELLIKEIHHRVKNNLQIVSSLLKLQSGHVKDQEALFLLTECQNRVQSMALVHQKLYQSSDLSKIDFREYIQQLLYHLFQALKIKSQKVELNINSESMRMGVDTAIPCGLIINELVSNSLKHAFTNQTDNLIEINLKKQNGKSYLLTVSDNGCGFPENIDFRNTSSLGMQLVSTLVNQLDGTIQLNCENGSMFTIMFSDLGYKERL